jgi:hypothetical protein
MAKRPLTEIYSIREDGVARRALADIIKVAKDSGQLSASEAEWADQLAQSVKSSEGDSMTFPKLALRGTRGADAAMQRPTGKPADTKQPTAAPAPAGAKPSGATPNPIDTDEPMSQSEPAKPGKMARLGAVYNRQFSLGNLLKKGGDKSGPQDGGDIDTSDMGDLAPAGSVGTPTSPKKSNIPPAGPQKMPFDTSDVEPAQKSLPTKKSGKLSKLFNFGKKKAG